MFLFLNRSHDENLLCMSHFSSRLLCIILEDKTEAECVGKEILFHITYIQRTKTFSHLTLAITLESIIIL